MPFQGVPPPGKHGPARATHCSLSGDPDVSPALPLSSESFVARATAPLSANVVEHGGGFMAAWLGSR